MTPRYDNSMNDDHPSDLLSRLEACDALPSEPLPAGWSRRSWVQRDALAFAAAAAAMIARLPEPKPE
jgi:hypothetical protein